MSKEGNYSFVFFILPFGTNSAAALLNVNDELPVERHLLSNGFVVDVLLSSITGVF
jgi:hypothetical protein